MMWLPVLQLSKAEDTYAPHRATFGSRFYSPSLGLSGMRKANKMADKFPIFNTSVDICYSYIMAARALSNLTMKAQSARVR